MNAIQGQSSGFVAQCSQLIVLFPQRCLPERRHSCRLECGGTVERTGVSATGNYGGATARLGGILVVVLALANATSAGAAVRYVDVSSASPTPPYTNWATAARVIQDAVDTANDGDTVLVANGIYAVGSRDVSALDTNQQPPQLVSVGLSRVVVTNAVRPESVNGPSVTTIYGSRTNSVRCMFLGTNAVLNGLTLTNGATTASGDIAGDGGAVWCESTNAFLTNCILTGNYAWNAGGGASGGTLYHCTLSGNSAQCMGGGACRSVLYYCTLNTNASVASGIGPDHTAGGGAFMCSLSHCTLTGNWISSGGCPSGGGACRCTLNNCTLTGNWTESSMPGNAAYGGGAQVCDLNNCTLTGNLATFGGGAQGCMLNNCIVYFNADDDCYWDCTLNYCCTTRLPINGVGNITNAPLFVNTNGWSNLHLQSNSPCINAGNSTFLTTTTDLDGNPRIVSGTVDIGASEYQGAGSAISYAWLQRYGLPTDGSVDAADPDADGHTTWQEWRCLTNPTNALSVLRLRSASPDGANVLVTWQSVEGVSYSVERATNLAGLPPVFPSLATNLPGQTGTTSFTDTNAASLTPLFYRIGVP